MSVVAFGFASCGDASGEASGEENEKRVEKQLENSGKLSADDKKEEGVLKGMCSQVNAMEELEMNMMKD